MKPIKSFVLRGKIHWVILVPLLIGFSVLFAYGLINNLLKPYISLDGYLYLALSIFEFCVGFSGLVQVIRKETYGPMRSIRGAYPVVTGVIVVIVTWSIGLWTLISWAVGAM